jgi:hypothetical protein
MTFMDHLHYATSIGGANSSQDPIKGMVDFKKYIRQMMQVYMDIHLKELQA